LSHHGFKQTAIKFERLTRYIDIDELGGILLRASGRKKVEDILKKDKE